jgi:hypothetical protein
LSSRPRTTSGRRLYRFWNSTKTATLPCKLPGVWKSRR